MAHPITQHHSVLQQGLSAFLDAPLSNWPQYAGQFYYRSMEPAEHWIQAGEVSTEICFVISGLLRVYYIDQNGNEVNQHFYQPGEVIAPVSAIVAHEPCQYFIQALEPSEVMLADYKAIHEAEKSNPEWLQLEISIAQNVLLKSARREARLLLGNAEHRYKWFCKEYPELLERLPQYHIASFLGITPVSLSRLRKKQ